MSPIESVSYHRPAFDTSFASDCSSRRMPAHRLRPLAALAVALAVVLPAQARAAEPVMPGVAVVSGTGTDSPAPADVLPVPPTLPAPAVPAGDAPTGAATLDEVLGDADDPLAQIEQQIQAEEFLPAIADLEQRIHVIESDSHRFDQRLVRPLTLLGDARAGQGDFDAALSHYQRALHLSRVNQGLNSPDQVEIVYREANAFKALGDYQQANDREEYAYHVLNRAHDPLDERLLPGIYHLASWYERTSNVFAARSLYQQAVAIIESHDKLDTAEAIPALKGIATSYRMERFPPFYLSELDSGEALVDGSALRAPITVNKFPEGEAALQRIIRIRQQQRDEDPVALARAVLDLADWYTLFDKPRRAGPLYAHAWELMAGVEDFDVVGYFAQPELLYFPAPGNPSPPAAESRGERATGYVEVAFDVTDDGYVRDLTTVGSQPDGLMDFRVRKSLRVARYRPMLVDGVPVPKQAHSYRHEFPYYPELEQEPRTAAATGG